MSWLRIDDGFMENGKVAPLSDAALRLWMLAGCWCQRNPHTDGFVPADLLSVISQNRWNQKVLKKLSLELVESRIAGTKEHGLWEEVDGGWIFHDWDNYQRSGGGTSSGTGVSHGPDTPRAKSAAGRLGGIKSAESRRLKNGTAQPKQTPKQTSKQTEAEAVEATPEADSKQSPEADRSKIEAPPEAKLEAPVPVPVLTTDSDPRLPPSVSAPTSVRDSARQSLRSLETAKNIPLQERSRLVLDNPDLANWAQPQQWPEVVRVAGLLAEALSQAKPKLCDLGRDSGLQAIVGLFADGFTLDELEQACGVAKTDPWFRKERRGLTSLTPEVVRRLLAPEQATNTEAQPGAHQLTADAAEAARARLAAEREEQRRQTRERLQREQQEQSA